MKVIEDKQNEFFKRKEVKVIVGAGKNPSTPEASKLIADEFKASEENIAIQSVKGKFGRNTFLIVANIYNSKEDKEKMAFKTRKQRKQESKGKIEAKQEEQKEGA